MTEWEHLAVCSDCLRAAANGIDDPYAVWGDGFPERWQAANARHGRELVAACPAPDHGDPDTGESCHRESFSWSPCDWCGDTLGGSRYCAAAAVESEPEPVLWECQCRECGGWILTDEWINGAPYFGSCGECGGQGEIDDWQVSDEPHPALWG